MPLPRTKIICTIGPSSQSPEVIRQLIESGMSVARLNFSHGTQAEHAAKIKTIRALAAELGRPVGILQDLAGPKIRVGHIPDPGIRLVPGQRFVLTGRPVAADINRVAVTYPSLAEEVQPQDRILLADGFMELKVLAVQAPEIICQVITGGMLTSHKGINLPSRTIRAPSLTAKDHRDLTFGLQEGVDFVALSFVRRAEEVVEVQDLIAQAGHDTPVIAKIEKHEAIENLETILRVADGVMVARGDLGVEVPLQQVPLLQKTIIQKANQAGKPVITATQMLRSMVESPRPTRAEAADVANAALDGTDAVMLSEETAIGSWPVAAVNYMAEILRAAETRIPHAAYLQTSPGRDIPAAVAQASCNLADQLQAKAVIAPTKSGQTARLIARFRPRNHLIALSPDPATVRRLTILWGCIPILVKKPGDTDDLLDKACLTVLDEGHVKPGDLVVVTAGNPVWVAGSTNMVTVRRL